MIVSCKMAVASSHAGFEESSSRLRVVHVGKHTWQETEGDLQEQETEGDL